MGETLGAPARLFVALGSVSESRYGHRAGQRARLLLASPTPTAETRLPADTYVETRPGPFRTPSMSFTILDTDITEQVFFDGTGLQGHRTGSATECAPSRGCPGFSSKRSARSVTPRQPAGTAPTR